ncbi:hypothetical protein [Streptomyces similanensis]|uniref:Integral membrane protein n=1 Tax=Streptomyces similanensis TaxID=1274988 RepID=A0ABP9L7V2_9ACTN
MSQCCTPENRCLPWRIGAFVFHLGWAGLLWESFSPLCALVFLVLTLAGSIRRARFVDVGRFTAGVWRASPAAPPVIVGIAWVLHHDGRKKAGVEIVVGSVCMGVFALMPRSEWPSYKRRKAESEERREGRRL